MKMPEFMVFGGIPEESFPTAAENRKNTQNVIDNWNLGPLKPSIQPRDNAEFWNRMAKAWSVDPKQARRQMCANCEYFQNSPDWQEKMEAIPLNAFDEGAGGRGFCEKFDFICHNLRTCQAWEEKEDEEEGGFGD